MDYDQDPDRPMDTERPLPQSNGSPKNAEHAIEIEEDEVKEEEVMTDVVECPRLRRRKKEMGKKKKEEEEKKKEEEEEDEKRNKEDDDEEEEVMADLVAKILSILKKKEMRRKKKREQEKKEEDEEEEDEAKRKKEDDEGKEENKMKKKENEKKEAEEEKKHFLRYKQQYKDIKNGHWKKAESAFDEDPSAIAAPINSFNNTALHVAVRTGVSIHFIENLVALMSKSNVEALDKYEATALHCAALVGYTEAARILVRKNASLTKLRDSKNNTPLHVAAQFAHKDTVLFLLPVTRLEDPSAFAGESGAMLLICLIIAEFYDIAIYLLKCYPDLAIQKDTWGNTGLDLLANKPDSFFSGNQLNFLQRLLYKCIYVEEVNVHHREDVENPAAEPEYPPHEPQQRKFKFLQHVRDTKLKHAQALQLTKILCAEIEKIKTLKTLQFFGSRILAAAQLGTHELVWEIVKAFPDAIWCSDGNGRRIFHVAVLNRKEKVYNLVYQMSLEKHYIMSSTDNSGNTLLHAAGMLGPSDRVSGAALQMQRELQWFKEVETVVQPSYRARKNKYKKTPRELFTQEHKDLVKKGEEWMKTTATSCTVVAALIITVVFAAAFTLPGGNDGEGFPIFLDDLSFMIFSVSNVLAFFASSTSMLMFLGILTSRYSEEDFLRALPMRLCIGLATLFLSIAFMLAAFSSALHIVLVHRLSWVAAPIIALACFPLTLFVLLQFPLLIEMTTSTFGRSIFHRQGKEIFF